MIGMTPHEKREWVGAYLGYARYLGDRKRAAQHAEIARARSATGRSGSQSAAEQLSTAADLASGSVQNPATRWRGTDQRHLPCTRQALHGPFHRGR